jgi:hypothetical protein
MILGDARAVEVVAWARSDLLAQAAAAADRLDVFAVGVALVHGDAADLEARALR